MADQNLNHSKPGKSLEQVFAVIQKDQMDAATYFQLAASTGEMETWQVEHDASNEPPSSFGAAWPRGFPVGPKL